MNQLDIVVFDFETGGLDTATLEPVQIAGKAYNGRTLEPYPGPEAEFCSLMRPLDMNNLDQRALDINKKTRAMLAEAPEQEAVWRMFGDWVRKYNRKGGKFGRPIPCGKNIRGFDLPILNRLCKTYKMVDADGKNSLFSDRYLLDVEDDVYRWFEGSNELPNYKMDTLRTYFGLSTEGAHDALVDVRQTAELQFHFFKLYRRLSPRVQFKGSLGRKAA